MIGQGLIRAVGLFSLVSVPLLLWCWIMQWIPESASDYVIVVGLLFFSITALACLHRPSNRPRREKK